MSERGTLTPQQLKKVTNYIHQNFDQKLSLAEIAATVNLSPYYFARLFKQSTGLPPHQYQLQCRIDRAQELLGSGKFAIAEIAQMAGFSSQGHLNYHFKRLVGVTPKAFLSK
ncbi:MAG: AraC family transcriptional regulator [Cyanobacteria bacterium J06559_3]